MLNGDSAGDEPEAIVGKESEVKPYDPNTQRRVVRASVCTRWKSSTNVLPGSSAWVVQPAAPQPDITVGPIKIQPYHEFARNLPVPTNLNLVI